MNQNQFSSRLNAPYSPPELHAHGNYSPQKSNAMKIVIIILSVLAVLGVCCCGGIGAIFYVGLRDMTEEVKGKLADVPEIKEHIGDISSLRADLSASFNHEDDETFVYDIVGTKGNGQVHVKHITDGDSEEVLVSGQLILPDGETIPLTIPPILDY